MDIINFLNIKTIECTQKSCILEMNITEQHLQPFGIMHGGISSLLAETAASMGANTYLDTTKVVAIGLDIHTSHLAKMKLGKIIATAIPIHVGKKTQNWSVNIHNASDDTLISQTTVNLINSIIKKHD